MPTPVKLSVPVEPRYRVFAPQVVGKYAELLGCSAAEADAVAAAVTEAIDSLARGAAADANADLTLATTDGEIAIGVSCGGRSSVVRRPLPADKA
jgi:hypothetical protein